MASHSNYGYFPHSVPPSYPSQAPQPRAIHGQSHAVLPPSFRPPTRKKSLQPTQLVSGRNDCDVWSHSRHAPAPITVGSFGWIALLKECLTSTLRVDPKRAKDISELHFLVLVESVSPQNEITFLFLYPRAPAVAVDTMPPRALLPHPRHSFVINPTTRQPSHHSRFCDVFNLPARDLHVWTAPPMTGVPSKVLTGRGSTVSAVDHLYTIRQHVQADLREQNAVWTKAAYNNGALHEVTSNYFQPALQVTFWTDASAFTLQSAADPSVLLGLLYRGSR